MVKIREAIVVEGKYDKNTLSQIVDTTIFQTDGFHIMKDKQLLTLLRQAAQKRGLIVMTDSDGGGLVIRNYLKSAISSGLKHAYIPDMPGKERRKQHPGKEGKLGVEGMRPEVILEALRRAGACFGDETHTASSCITKQDMVELGLSGGNNSAERRSRLLKKLDLPGQMSANAMLSALNLLMTKEELALLVASLEKET